VRPTETQQEAKMASPFKILESTLDVSYDLDYDWAQNVIGHHVDRITGHVEVEGPADLLHSAAAGGEGIDELVPVLTVALEDAGGRGAKVDWRPAILVSPESTLDVVRLRWFPILSVAPLVLLVFRYIISN
jgi:hypothetical protein